MTALHPDKRYADLFRAVPVDSLADVPEEQRLADIADSQRIQDEDMTQTERDTFELFRTVASTLAALGMPVVTISVAALYLDKLVEEGRYVPGEDAKRDGDTDDTRFGGLTAAEVALGLIETWEAEAKAAGGEGFIEIDDEDEDETEEDEFPVQPDTMADGQAIDVVGGRPIL